MVLFRYASGMADEERSADSRHPSVNPRIKSGVDWELEALADQLLSESRKGVTKVSEKRDFLTTDQLERRRSREVYNQKGVPEPHLYSGLYRRCWNPDFGHRKPGPTNDHY
jgi:hypothetical protein